MWSTPDLSNITLVLTGLLNEAVVNSTLAQKSIIKVSPSSPETLRESLEQCHLTLYLLHIGRDPSWRNTPLAGMRPLLNSAQPLSLSLSYLLSAYYAKDAVLEQRAMSIALQAIQSNPIMNSSTAPATVNGPDWGLVPNGEFVISIEADTIEEMSRLWQAFTVPIRLSALIRASVIFIAAPDPAPVPALPPSIANIAVAPFADQPAPSGTQPLLVPGLAQQTPPLPDGVALAQLQPGIFPLVAVGGVPAPAQGTSTPLFGSYLVVAGEALDLPGAAKVYLSAPGSDTLWDITSWRQTLAAGMAGGKLILAPPDTYAVPAGTILAATPPPGIYRLAVGTGGHAVSNWIAIAIAPRIDRLGNPQPLTADAAGIFSVSGAGFMPEANVTLALGSSALAWSGAAGPADGQFIILAGGAGIKFKAPASLAAGQYPLLLAVNGISAPIGWLAAVA